VPSSSDANSRKVDGGSNLRETSSSGDASSRKFGRGSGRPKVVVTATFAIDQPRHGGQHRCRHL
jgi:hypothetical protein